MLAKSRDFHLQFMKDLIGVVLTNPENFKEQYKAAIQKDPELKVDYNHRPFKSIMIRGSYPEKSFGQELTDIDLFQLLTIEKDGKAFPPFIKRLKEVLNNSERYNFIFLRLYLGRVEELQPPWNYDANGGCNFNYDKMKEWQQRVNNIIPSEITRQQINNILNQPQLSLKNLLEVEKIIEPMMSISWSKQDILKGYKVLYGKRYNFEEVLVNSQEKKLLKFVYVYVNPATKMKDYCLVDVSIVKWVDSDEREKTDFYNIASFSAFYQADIRKMIQSLRGYIPADKQQDYKNFLTQMFAPYSAILARQDLIDKLDRYSDISKSEISRLQTELFDYIQSNPKIPLKTIKEMKTRIQEIGPSIFDKVLDLVSLDKKYQVFLLLLRETESNQPLSISTIQARTKNGNSCPFFPIATADIKNMFFLANRAFINPHKLLECFYQSCVVNNTDPYIEASRTFTDANYSIKIFRGQAILYQNNNIVREVPERDLKQLQSIVLFGL